jgi:hypothetical protein
MRLLALRRHLTVTCTTFLLAAGCTDRESATAPSESSDLSPQLASAVLAGTSTNAPELPRSTVDTRIVAPTGKTIAVPSGGNLQQAIDQAQPGDVITLQAGASYVGNFYLRNKSGSGWITIRTSASDASLPAPGTRITPSYAGVLPKILSPNSMPALGTDNSAHHYRLIGIEVGVTSSTTLNYGLVRLGSASHGSTQIANNIILDRVYLHGHGTVHLKRCVELNSATSAVIDSYLSECHGQGQDTQAILGWNGPGPYKIENNHLEGAGENVMFGGADASIPGLVPSDITIRRNYFYKPPAWKGKWTVKNSFELKSAQRLLIEGNVFENNWADAQDGFAIVWKSVNQNGACTWCIVQDVTFRYNRIRNSANGINLVARPQGTVAGPLRRVLITHNVVDHINVGPIYYGNGRMLQVMADVTDLAVEHNTMFTTSGTAATTESSATTTARVCHRSPSTRRGTSSWGTSSWPPRRAPIHPATSTRRRPARPDSSTMPAATIGWHPGRRTRRRRPMAPIPARTSRGLRTPRRTWRWARRAERFPRAQPPPRLRLPPPLPLRRRRAPIPTRCRARIWRSAPR